MTNCLYVNSKGQSWRRHSYSAGTLWDRCPYAYYLQKILGWRERDNKAAFAFGRALEESIQFLHENNAEGAVEDFTKRWAVHKDNAEMKYSKVEKDWASLNKAGSDMIKLYQIKQPSLPLPLGGATVFQREYSKPVFEGDPNFEGIEFMGKVDIISYVDPEHPLLPKLQWLPEYGALRPLVVDIKTSAMDFGENYGLASFDLQLRAYSWLTGIRDCALLWFKKNGHNLQKGSSVTLLEAAGSFVAGQEAVVALVEEEDVWLLPNDFMVSEMENSGGRKPDGKLDQTNVAKQKRREWLEKFSTRVPSEIVTKQRLQFNAGFVSIESSRDAGIIAGRQISEICHAWNTKQYPNSFGVRFPHDDRNDPYFKAFVLNDENFRNTNFTKSDDGALDDLFDEPDAEDAQ